VELEDRPLSIIEGVEGSGREPPGNDLQLDGGGGRLNLCVPRGGSVRIFGTTWRAGAAVRPAASPNEIKPLGVANQKDVSSLSVAELLEARRWISRRNESLIHG